MFVKNFQIFAYFCWEKPKITMKKILRGSSIMGGLLLWEGLLIQGVFYYGGGLVEIQWLAAGI
jgi:hypothetical protein